MRFSPLFFLLPLASAFVTPSRSRSPSNGCCCCLAASKFSEDELIVMTKEYIANPSPDIWSDDFVFRGPVIGPLVKKDLINTLTALSPEDSFEDFKANVFGFSVDPVEPNRVWWLIRPRGNFTKTYSHPVFGDIPPNNQVMIAPPEARSVIWDDEGKIKYQSVGYVTDRFTGDTTDGLGAIFGIYRHFGIEIDGTVGSPVTQFLQWLTSSVLPAGAIPKSFSKDEDIPTWWTDKRRGAEK